MWKSISFEGHFEQIVYGNLREKNGVIVPVTDPETGYYHGSGKYNAFDRDELIPSLTKLVERVTRKGKPNEECKKWIKENGFLTLPRYMLPKNGQSLEEFWNETIVLVDLWKMYGQVVNRDIEALKNYLKISIEPLTADEIENEEFLWGKGADGRVVVNGDAAFGIVLKEVEEDPLAPYQFAVLHLIAEKISYNIGNVSIGYRNIIKQSGSDSDVFTIQAYLEPSTLIQAMYMQFMQILTEKRKVCRSCWISFTPKRKDQVFCKPGCRYTENTRNRRAKKNEREES